MILKLKAALALLAFVTVLAAVLVPSEAQQGGIGPGPGTVHAVSTPTPLPYNGVLDNFNRGTGLGTNWSTASGVFGGTTATACTIASSTYLDCTWPKASYWNATQFGNKQEAYATCVHAADCILYVRLQQIGAGTTDGYYVNRTSTTNVQLGKITNGTVSALKNIALSTSNGDSFGVRHDGSTLFFLYKPSAGSWSVYDSVADSTYTGNGYIGCGSGDDNDDFGGGDVP